MLKSLFELLLWTSAEGLGHVALREAGVGEFIHAGADAVTLLQAAYQSMEQT